MHRHDQAVRKWRPREHHKCHPKAATAFLIFSALSLAGCAWLTLVFSSRNSNCFDTIQDWHPNPALFALPPSMPSGSSPASNESDNSNLMLHHIAFGIAGSAQLWPKRKEFVKLWWRPQKMLGFVWLEEQVVLEQEEAQLLPPVMVSEDVSSFRYTHSTGHPSGVRIARIIKETFKLNLPDVRWFVLGDDDTIFSTDNLLRMLNKYDYRELYYIGHPSESHSSNTCFSHGMAFGGGGIAISYPLAEILSKMLDSCLERYPFLFGSDDRLHACITEIGVPLTREDGFHQFDIHGNAFGLLAAHPTAPFISMHHLDEIDPVFPKLDLLSSLQQLTSALKKEPSSFLQQCICYDQNKRLSFSISLGYVVQVYPYITLPKDLSRPEITFMSWYMKDEGLEFDLDTRKPLRSICNKPFIYFLEYMHIEPNNVIVSTYKRDTSIDEAKMKSFCFSRVLPPEEVERVQVLSRPLDDHWFRVPKRQCCRLTDVKDKVMKIVVSPC